ncbi:MAG: class I SAM-dependent methyltransferase [Bacteroidota bacterium]
MAKLSVRLFLLKRYLHYYWRAQTRHDVHSPFLATVVENILEDTRTFYAFPIIEGLRERLASSQTIVQTVDYGAGSKVKATQARTIRSLTQGAAISATVGQQLFRAVLHFKPKTILELGTSLGISSLYLAAAAPHARMITIEGCPQTARLAAQNFDALSTPHIQLLNAPFAAALPKALEQLKQVDLCYIDGDHQRESTLVYVRTILPYLHPKSVLIIADINWSEEMVSAWEKLKELPIVSRSMELYHYGMLFFDEAATHPQHLTAIPAWQKPWRLGFWGKKAI